MRTVTVFGERFRPTDQASIWCGCEVYICAYGAKYRERIINGQPAALRQKCRTWCDTCEELREDVLTYCETCRSWYLSMYSMSPRADECIRCVTRADAFTTNTRALLYVAGTEIGPAFKEVTIAQAGQQRARRVVK